MVIPVLVSLGIFWLSTEYFFYKMLELGRNSNLQAEHPFYTFISVQKKDLSTIIFLGGLFLSMIIIFWGLILSRQIAGPILKLQIYLDKINTLEGLEKLSFRKNDFFQEISASFNAFILRIKK